MSEPGDGRTRDVRVYKTLRTAVAVTRGALRAAPPDPPP